MEDAISDIYNHESPPEGFFTKLTNISLEDGERFREFFLNKQFCPCVLVDLAKLKEGAYINCNKKKRMHT